MKKDFCDICEAEIREGDLHLLSITRLGEKEAPSIKSLEICVYCKEKIVDALNNKIFL